MATRWIFVFLILSTTAAALAQDGPAQNPLSGLEPLLGPWGYPPEALEEHPQLRGRAAHLYSWTVGQNALRIREGYPQDDPEAAELDGLVFWNPSSEQIEFVAVAGPGPDAGRQFSGEYQVLADGRIQRVYDVAYRTLADTPGEDQGGHTRRYREVYTRVGDRLHATLDWWRDGEWQPFGPGEYELVRLQP